MEFFNQGLAVLEERIKGETFGEGKLVFFGKLFGFGIGDNLGFVVILEEVFEFGLVEDDDCAVDNGDLVVVGHFEGDFSREGFEAVAAEFPRGAAFEGGAGGNTFRDVEDFGLTTVAGVSEFGEDAFNFFELVDVVVPGVDVAIFVLDEVDEGFGATDIAEFCTIDDFILAVGFLVFATLEAFVGFFDDVAGGFLHEHGFHAGGEGVGITHAEGGVILIKEK